MATGHAKTEVNPRSANAQTILTTVGAGYYFSYFIQMRTVFRHIIPQDNLSEATQITQIEFENHQLSLKQLLVGLHACLTSVLVCFSA